MESDSEGNVDRLRKGYFMDRFMITKTHRTIIAVISAVIIFVLVFGNGYSTYAEAGILKAEDATAQDATLSESTSSVNLTNEVDEIFRIEQVRSVAPYIRAFFYPDDNLYSDSVLRAVLDDKRYIATECDSFANKGFGIDYYFLIDNSKSVDAEEFEAVKEQIASMPSMMNDKDSISIYVVGDFAEKKAEKLGKSNEAQLRGVLDEIERNGMHTNLYNAIKDAATDIASQDTDNVFEESEDLEGNLGLGKNRSVIVAVTDGVNDSENGYGKDETISKLNDNCIPLYLIQQKMQGESGSESRSDIQQVVRQTGGEFLLTADHPSDSIVGALVKRLSSCMVATFEIDSNKVDTSPRRFNIEYGPADGSSEFRCFNTKDIVISKHMKDNSAPEVKSIKFTGEHSIEVTFSEPVSGEANNVSLYEVSDERNKTYKPTGADYSVDGRDKIVLSFSDTFYNGKHEIKIASGITDNSEEANKLGEVKKEVKAENFEDYVEEKESFFIKYWWVIILAFIIIVIIILIIIFSVIKKRKGIVVNDGKVVLADQMEEKVHVKIVKNQTTLQQPGQPAQPIPKRGMPITLNLRSGNQPVKSIQAHIDGSVIVGRANICDVIIDDVTMSRQHFAIENDGGTLYIMDLDTKNGTFVNGVKLTGRRRLEQNDRINAGSLDIIIRW